MHWQQRPLDPAIEGAIEQGNIVAASVLSGTAISRPASQRDQGELPDVAPLVVAFALAGRVDIDMEREPIGTGKDGHPVYLRDIWPSHEEIQHEIARGIRPEMFKNQYSDVLNTNPKWREIAAPTGALYEWKDESTYIQLPPFFEGFGLEPGDVGKVNGMRALAIFGDSVTTDHISPAGSIPADGPAGKHLIAKGVEKNDFNSFGSRRGNDRIMTRGTFANVRIKNLMAGGREGGWTKLMPEGELMHIFEACAQYRSRGTPLIVFAGVDYGMGSSRDWAAKGTALLGVRAVVAKSFERIHRSNLIGMACPLQFREGQDAKTLGLDGSETFSIEGLGENPVPLQDEPWWLKRLTARNNRQPYRSNRYAD
jgi:aconitate hydratase